MRASTFALVLTALLAVPAAARADDISDCNSDKAEVVIKGCSSIIDAGKASPDAIALAHFYRANAYDDSGDHDSAIADYTQTLKLKPQYADGYFNRALAYRAKEDYDNALADLGKALEIDPKYAQAYFVRASVYEAQGDLKKALAGYEEAAQIVPKNKKLQQKIADIKQQLGQ